MFLNHALAHEVIVTPERAWTVTPCQLTGVLGFMLDQANVLWRWGFEDRYVYSLSKIGYVMDVYEQRIRSLDEL